MFNYLVSRYTFDISILEDETGKLTEQNLEKEIRNFILNTYKRDRVKVISSNTKDMTYTNQTWRQSQLNI